MNIGTGAASLVPADPGAFKACCAAAYSTDWMALLLGESFHPGGLALTRRLLDGLALEPGGRLLDVASGRGTSALLAAEERPITVCGVDLARENVDRAHATAGARGLRDRCEFRVGDAEVLPVRDGEFDAVICECALCTFPDKRAAVAEMTRALRPGGRLGISDVTADLTRLPPRLRGQVARIACIADASSAATYVTLLQTAGLEVEAVEAHDEALAAMAERIEARLLVLDMLTRSAGGSTPPVVPNLDRAEAAAVLAEVRAAIEAGSLGYGMFVARKPAVAAG